MLPPTLYTGLAVNVNGIVYPCPSSTCPVILGKCVIIPYTPTCCDTGNFTPTCTPRLPSSSRITGGFANPPPRHTPPPPHPPPPPPPPPPRRAVGWGPPREKKKPIPFSRVGHVEEPLP